MVGDVLAGRYELEELVGSGGMSSVYRAHDRVLERKVALKVLHQRLTSEDEYVERFRREARMVAGLLHQNIVTVIDRGDDDGQPFIVFEFVAGENLKQLVNREGPLPVDRALELAMQVARGLAFAHANGYVHRDVKPQNVLLNGDGEAKVTDFGIARSLDVKHGVTQTGTVLGTSDYIAPEQAQGQQVDEHTDVYSLGIVLYELLVGEVPFSGDNFVAVAMQHINDPAPRVSERRPDVSPRIDAAVARALAKQPEDRFATMAEFCHELEACLEEVRTPGGASTVVLPPPQARPSRSRPSIRRRRGRTPLPAVLVAIGLAIAVAALAFALVRDDNHSPGSSSAAGGGGAGPVALSGVGAYDPPPGDGEEHDDEAANATDTSSATYWETQHYRSSFASLGKHGVGLVLDARRAVTLHQLTVTTDTPGFSAQIQAGDSASGPFRAVSDVKTVSGQVTFELRDAHARYFVVWITNLGSLASAHVNDVNAS
jgi:eukaryotic-like serine/threonine-protein kinase